MKIVSNSHIHPNRSFNIKTLKHIVVLLLCYLVSNASRANIDNTKTNDMEAIYSKCSQKWGWENMDSKVGIPKIRVIELKGLDSVLPSNSKAYTVKVFNKEAVYRKPLVFTYACVVVNGKLIFIENDKDALSLINTSLNLTDISHVMKILEAFTLLRGYRIQVGVPSKTNPWVFKPDYGPLYEIYHEEHKNPIKWTFLIDRNDKGWNVECALVSIDDFTTYRYRISLPIVGTLTFRRQDLVYSSPPAM